MDYYEFVFTVASDKDFHRDLLIHALSEAGFDTFEETGSGFKGYISSASFEQDTFDRALSAVKDHCSVSFEKNIIPQKNWNEEWESNFEPMLVRDTCYVRATFHKPNPKYPLEIVIDPKMAFGTGHHQTTTMMMEYLLGEDLHERDLLDMGCGTGILAILAEKLGARNLVAIDNDPVCYQSTLENLQLNNCLHTEARCGSKEAIPEKAFHIILANINRNILIDQIERYSDALAPGGSLVMSGFYEDDLSLIQSAASLHHLDYQNHKVLNSWTAVKFIKQKLN